MLQPNPKTARSRGIGPLLLLLLVPACAHPPESGPAPSRSAPFVVILGTAQDGGLPQIGCEDRLCRDARRDPSRRRLVTSLLLVDPRQGRRWLFDASPDLPEQVVRADDAAPRRDAGAGRPPLFDGIFLTHAHVGHYAGLLHLGREAYGARAQPVLATDRMAGFLRANGPWSLLVADDHIRIEVIEPDQPVRLADDLTVTAIVVPHRDEFSDTVAFLIRGPGRALLYLPDIDKWERWDRRIEDALADVDVALLDGTFFADGEIPGRSMAAIPHPFVEETLARFASRDTATRGKIVFTHLNHTNPASDSESDAAARIRAAGMSVARERQILELGRLGD